jgi:hypothetical protein
LCRAARFNRAIASPAIRSRHIPAREPHRIERRIIRAVQKARQTQVIRPGEMAIECEALRVNMQFHIGELRGNSLARAASWGVMGVAGAQMAMRMGMAPG